MKQSIIEIIKKRHSVRNYSNQSVEEEKLKQIKEYIEKLSNPWGESVRIRFVEMKGEKKEQKLGTYGVIKGAKYYLAVAAKKGPFAYEAIGYTFEHLILFCTSMGLGTVWLGGTFKKGAFAKAIDVTEDEIFTIISPLGYPGDETSFLANFFSKTTGKRKDFSELFYDEDFSTPLSEDSAGKFEVPLEMVRLAPSGVNKQPWRILKQGTVIHFYLDGKGELNHIDMGIAMCHFEVTAKELGYHGRFEKRDPQVSTKYSYITTWIEKE